MNYERLASQLIRVLRGRRSQPGLSRRLGCRSNVIYAWESGVGFPTAARFFGLLRRVGVEPMGAIQRFYQRAPSALRGVDLTTPTGVSELLVDLRGTQSIKSIAQASGRDRFAVARWLKGTTQPRLPDFLLLVQATTLRLLDFLGSIVDPTQLTEVAAEWKSLEAARQASHAAPWSQAVLRLFELESYKALSKHPQGFMADRLGITQEQEAMAIELLLSSGQIIKRKGLYRANQAQTVDTRRDSEATRRLAAWCATEGKMRIETGRPGHFAFNLFGVSAKDFERIRQLQREYFAQLRAIVAESKVVERVAVVNVQLFAVGEVE